MSLVLQDQVALVTGGTRGIGRAIALELASRGATVVITGRDEARSQAAASELNAEAAGQVLGRGCDVTDLDALGTLVTELAKEHGRLDILVNNAGITRDTLIARMKIEDWCAVMKTNLTSAFVACKAASRVMTRARAGRIINITSVVGLTGNAGQCNYAASKAGLIGFSKSLAREVGGRGVTVNCVAPGFIETDMTSDLPDAVKEGILGNIPLGRLGQAEEVAQAVAYLASPGAGYVTGSVLNVDGGMAM